MRGSNPDLGQTGAGRYLHLLAVYDTLISALIVGPAVVGYWRGTWQLMDHYAFPEHRERSCFASLAIGLVGHFVFTVLQYPLARLFHPDTRRLTYYIVSRAYTVVFAFCCVNAWRGAWNMLDVYTGKHMAPVLGITLASVCALMITRTLRNLSAPPFAVATDAAEGYFEVHTMFRVSKSGDTPMYVMDVLFSIVIIGNLVVFVWRGTWTMVDILLFPAHPAYSAWASLALGYAIVAVSFSLQPLMKRICDRLDLYPRIIIADIYLLFSFIGTINVWRGIWNLVNIYFTGTSVLSYWLLHGFCLSVLVLLNCANSLLVRGVYIDAAKEEGGDCVEFQCSYLRLFVQAERELKSLHKGQPTTTKRKIDVENKTTLLQDQQTNNTGNHALAQVLLKPSSDVHENQSIEA